MIRHMRFQLIDDGSLYRADIGDDASRCQMGADALAD